MDELKAQMADFMKTMRAEQESMMQALTNERKLREEAEAKLAETQELVAKAAKEPQKLTVLNAVPVCTPEKYDGTRGMKAETFISQIGLYMLACPDRFPTDKSKVSFAISYLTGHASRWAQPYLEELFGDGENIPTFAEFTASFKGMFFDPERKHRAELALRSLKQTSSVSSYTQSFNQHAHDAGWEAKTLVSQYRHGLKEKVRLALVLARTDFATLEEVQTLALRIGSEIDGSTAPQPTSSHHTTAPKSISSGLGVDHTSGSGPL